MGAVILSTIMFLPFYILFRVVTGAERRRAFRREWHRPNGRQWERRPPR